MATSINSSCQHLTNTTLRAARHVSRQRFITRRYASTIEGDVPRNQETEELPRLLKAEQMSSMAHVELQTHRELRNMARTAAWEMPLLSALSKPFEPPTSATPLRWRYTTYLGELHPAASKVVVEFSLRDLKNLDEEQKQTLRKLAGARWDPDTDIIKMSCESFASQAQNKRSLGETIAALIKEAKEGEDKFIDIPLDTRHAADRMKRRQRRALSVSFPEEWRMTPERRAQLDAQPGRLSLSAPESESTSSTPQAARTLPTDPVKLPQATTSAQQPVTSASSRPVVNGIEAIEAARQAASQAASLRMEELVRVDARRPPPKAMAARKGANPRR